ncbi:MAG TPA: hypothetical protein VF432_09490 [Thermoanaerobaculia bacterium]
MSEVSGVLARLRERRAELAAELAGLDRAIAAIEEASREAAPPRVEAPPAPIAPAPEKPAGPYRYLGFYEAAAAYLREAGEPKTVREIADGLLAGGYATTATNFRGSIRAMLRRWQPMREYGIRETDDGGRWFVGG